MDISKAYDSVSRQSLEHVLETYGAGATTRDLIAQLYEDEILVYDDNRTLELSSTCGVKQGCILSPWIFTLYMDIVLCETKTAHPTAYILMYADDIAIATASIDEMQNIANTGRNPARYLSAAPGISTAERQETTTRNPGQRCRTRAASHVPHLDGIESASAGKRAAIGGPRYGVHAVAVAGQRCRTDAARHVPHLDGVVTACPQAARRALEASVFPKGLLSNNAEIPPCC